MKHQLILFFGVFIVIFFVLVNIPSLNLTGAIIAERQESYAITLNDVVNKFFKTGAIVFPQGGCSDIAQELYGNIAYKDLHVTSGYSTTERERIATINFGIDRGIGTVDMIKGESLLSGKESDSMISLNSETVVRVPPDPMRMTFFKMDLFGDSKGVFTVSSGTFSTPSLDCSFVNDNGKAACDCRSHPIEGISTG